MKKVLLALAVVIVLGVAGFLLIGNKNGYTNSSNSSAKTPSSAANSSNSASNQSATSTSSVNIQDMAFAPRTITVKKGTTVTWTNQDSVEHSVIVDSGDGPKSDLLSQGESYTFKFDTAGTFKYHCGVHPSMTGTVTVTE